MTNYQEIILRRLRDEFGVDTAPAVGLDGLELDAWIDQADDQLFADLLAGMGAPVVAH